MAGKISAGRFRLLCREVAGKVAARHDRENASEEAVLRELLRRLESHLGRRPAELSRHEGDGLRGPREEIDRLFDGSDGSSWAPIAEEELLAELFRTGKRGGTRASGGRKAQDGRVV